MKALLAALLLTLGSLNAHAQVLYIGDSHTAGTFGRTLDGLLRTLHPSIPVVTVGSCGSSPEWWFTGHRTNCGYFFNDGTPPPRRNPRVHATPLLSDLLSTYSPRVTVVALGANMINQSPAFIKANTRKLARAVVASGSQCIWVGPPHGGNKPPHKLNPLYEALQKGVIDSNGIKLCDLIDSRPYAPWPEGRDGRHFEELGFIEEFGMNGRDLARRWARSIFEEIKQILGSRAF